MTSSCSGARIVAADGTFLGNATSEPSAPNGVCNPNSTYGRNSLTSIWCGVCDYGSISGELSANDISAKAPPKILCNGGTMLAWVTKNVSVGVPIVRREDLCATLAAKGL